MIPQFVPTKVCSASLDKRISCISVNPISNNSFNPFAIPHSSAADELTPEPSGKLLAISQSKPLIELGLIILIW